MSLLESIKRKLTRRTEQSRSSSKPVALSDFTEDEWAIYQSVRPYTMTSPERILALMKSIDHVVKNELAGDVVECGVWRGGSMMAVIQRLTQLECSDRELWLYDTFDGMSTPTDVDVGPDGVRAASRMATESKTDSAIWACSRIDEVRTNIAKMDYPADNIRFIEGKVEDTLATHVPDRIAVLRLDTDWYESTKAELDVLYDKVIEGGIVIIDDYGHWDGCRKAVDEFLDAHHVPILLHRIDYTGRTFVKPAG